MPLSLYAANKVLNDIDGKNTSGFGSTYIGFLTSDPVTAQNVQTYNEPLPHSVADNGYRRVVIGEANGQTHLMSTPSNGETHNTSQIVGTECINEDWDGIVAFGVFTSQTVGQGQLIAWGRLQDAQGQTLTTPVYVTQGKIPIFRVNTLSLSFDLTEPTVSA